MLIEWVEPMMQKVVFLSDAALHPILSRYVDAGLSLFASVAVKTSRKGMDPFCDGCYGFSFCVGIDCSGYNCGSSCSSAYVGCSSGGTCWTVRGTYAHCCDCYCCHTVSGVTTCHYCICSA